MIQRKGGKSKSKDLNDEKSRFYYEIHESFSEMRDDGISINLDILTL